MAEELNCLNEFLSCYRRMKVSGNYTAVCMHNQPKNVGQKPGCPKRKGEFFWYKNQACSPSLSVAGRLHLNAKSDILVCLNDSSEAKSEASTSVVIDGAAIF